jgi:hypothetical protein
MTGPCPSLRRVAIRARRAVAFSGASMHPSLRFHSAINRSKILRTENCHVPTHGPKFIMENTKDVVSEHLGGRIGT